MQLGPFPLSRLLAWMEEWYGPDNEAEACV